MSKYLFWTEEVGNLPVGQKEYSDFKCSFLFFQEIYKDRKKFSKQVFEVASSDLVNMGITVVSYTLKDIRDDEVRRVHFDGKS